MNFPLEDMHFITHWSEGPGWGLNQHLTPIPGCSGLSKGGVNGGSTEQKSLKECCLLLQRNSLWDNHFLFCIFMSTYNSWAGLLPPSRQKHLRSVSFSLSALLYWFPSLIKMTLTSCQAKYQTQTQFALFPQTGSVMATDLAQCEC